MRIKQSVVAAVAAVIGAAAAPAAMAQQSSDVQYKFSGFGTVGAAMQTSGKGEFRTGVTQSGGADRTPDFGVDSRAGIQASALLGPDITLTGQVYAARAGKKDLDPVVEWFFAQYKAAPWLDLRAGRMVLPIYLVSDFRNVGYATPWLRAPSEIYGGSVYSHFDGFQAVMRVPVGEGQLTLQPSFGRANAAIELGGASVDFTAKPVGGISATFEQGDVLARLGQTRQNATNKVGGTVVGSANDSYTTAGLQYDNGAALLISEFARRKTGDGGYNGTSWYVTGGWHFGNWLPNLTYGKRRPTGYKYVTNVDTDSVALGLRYEATKNLALKGQVERRSIDPNGFAGITNSSYYNDRATIVSVVADFVF